MKKHKIYLLLGIFALFAVMPADLFAGDYAALDFIGFSGDGKYLAFEEYGTQDGSGFPFATVYFIDTEKNSFIGAPFSIISENDKATEDSTRKKAELAAAKTMLKLKIVRGNTGKLLVAHLLNDWTYDNSFVRNEGKQEKVRFNDYMNPNSPNQYEFFELTLNSIPVAEQSCTEKDFFTHYKLELTLDHFMEGKRDVETRILQKDESLPKRRNCPYGYRIESVYIYKDKIAVFLNVFSHGYEGPDMRYLVVTGDWENRF